MTTYRSTPSTSPSSFSSTVFAVKALERGNESASLSGRLAIGILILAHVADYATFVFMTARHGLGAELNPLVATIFEDWGLALLTVAKFATVLLVASVFLVVGRTRPRLAVGVLAVGVFVGTLGGRMLTWAGFPVFLVGLWLPRRERLERLFDIWLLAVVIVLPLWGTHTYPPSRITQGYADRSQGQASVRPSAGTLSAIQTHPGPGALVQ